MKQSDRHFVSANAFLVIAILHTKPPSKILWLGLAIVYFVWSVVAQDE